MTRDRWQSSMGDLSPSLLAGAGAPTSSRHAVVRDVTILGAATTRWGDYVGTAAADDADALPESRSLYELAGIDRDRWAIVAIDLAVVDDAPTVSIYAAQPAEVTSTAPAENRTVRVTEFVLAQPTLVETLINEAFKEVRFRLVARAASGSTIDVADRVTV